MTERIVGRPWTAEEDRLLANAVAIHGESDNWKAVAHCVPERTNKACRKASRWLHSLSPNVKKSAWTPEEDHLLLELYEVHSTKWSVIARHIPGRTDDACSKRYREALDPSLRRDEWSKEEDDKLFDAYSRLAGRWGQVGQELQRSGLACRNRWRLLERKRHNLTEPQGVAVSKLSSTMSSDLSSPILTYPDPTPWPPPPMLNPRQYWGENLSQFDGGPSLASGQQHSHVRSHNDVGLLGSVETSVSHPQSIQHVDNLPPPFHYSSSSLSSALSSPHTLAMRYDKSTAAPSGSYQMGETHAVPHPITSVPPADNATAVFDYGVVLDPSLVNATRVTDYAVGHRPVYEDHVAKHQYNEIQRSLAPTPVPSHTPVPPQRASEYYSPVPRHNDPKTIGLGAKRGPPQDTLSPNPDDPNPRPTARPRQSFVRKRADINAPLRLSSDLPATNDPSIKPYACGHESCWPVTAPSSLACYTTSRGLSDHNKSSHPEDSGGERPYRCGLDGCGKTWKARHFGSESINGLQYHLQISKAHFQHAIVSTFVTSYIDGLTVPHVEASTGESDGKTKKQYSCPHQGCPNRYKQLSGLRYHLTHGHPTDLPVQLDLVPPALSRKLAEKMRKDGTGSQPPETHAHKPLPASTPSQSCSPGHESA
ncbi:uncharacterized protein EDB93DRAFT_1079460 [Suillus bovinus]|uniref:uncharacterized protein n=1 Tax=Suillus bovinus TaxID=48563 RepID=UPI001B871298|nr:uncharacterized protein EDB93DRAFT_1079460 [Suillus bovinus]KAG2156524.1 hypothetical protein EDB93DRAFT_1079460 [Suillus bovinus]